jgi:protein SCO1/2
LTADASMPGLRAYGFLAVLLLVALRAFGAAAQAALPPDESRTLGQPVADAVFVDAQGSALAVRSLAGRPVVVSPIFTRCQYTCPTITASLEQAVAQVGTPGEDFEVLSLSFDVADTPADLARYRARMDLPEAWKLARADAEALLPFLDSIDFRFISNPHGGFTHPNLVVVLSPELTVAKYLHGTAFEAEDLRAALALARGEGSVLHGIAPYLFVVGVLGALLAAFVLALLIGRIRSRPSKRADLH